MTLRDLRYIGRRIVSLVWHLHEWGMETTVEDGEILQTRYCGAYGCWERQVFRNGAWRYAEPVETGKLL